MRRLVVVTIATAVACVVLLAAFDVPSALRDKLRPWILSRLDAPITNAPRVVPRWARERKSEALAVSPGFASGLRVSDPDTVSVRRASVDGVSRTAIEGQAPHRFELEVEVPADGELWLSLNQHLPASAARAIEYEVRFAGAETASPLFLTRLPARHRDWQNVRIDLGSLGPGPATLSFQASLIGATGIAVPDAILDAVRTEAVELAV